MTTYILEADKTKYKNWIWYVIGVVVVSIGFVIGQSPLTALIAQYHRAGRISMEQATEFYATANFEAIGISSALGLLLILGSFIGGLIALLVYVRFIHGRNISSLVRSTDVQWRKVLFGFGIWFLLTAMAEFLLYIRAPETYELIFHWSSWFPLMLVVIFILPIQTSFEELFVRGYLLQGIGLATNRPWMAVIMTSLIFGLMHGTNPEIREFGVGIMMVYYISVAVFLAVITILDDGLEYALGIHAATNIYGAGFVTYKGSALQTETLVKVSIVEPIWLVALFYISVIVFVLLAHARHPFRKWDILFQPVTTVQPAIVDDLSEPAMKAQSDD